jgi:hypothetical protein
MTNKNLFAQLANSSDFIARHNATDVIQQMYTEIKT